MKIIKKMLEGIYEITEAKIFIDKRGFMLRTYDEKLFSDQGISVCCKQQSVSYTAAKNVVRGLNVQLPPFAEGKLISILNGEVFWVSVDLRKESRTFGKWSSSILSKNGVNGLFVKPGFAHGCLSLTDYCYLLLNADNYYSQEHGTGIAWNDRDLEIEWPLNGSKPVISDSHSAFSSFSAFVSKFGGI